MVYEVDYPVHKCGKVVDFCTYHDTTIYFCVFCKKVTGAAKVSQIKITLGQMNEYDEALKQSLV